jgi:hypothetical protein
MSDFLAKPRLPVKMRVQANVAASLPTTGSMRRADGMEAGEWATGGGAGGGVWGTSNDVGTSYSYHLSTFATN